MLGSMLLSLAALSFCVFGVFVYMFRGRFHRVAFVRRFRVNKCILKLINSVSDNIDCGMKLIPMRETNRFDTSTPVKALVAYTLFIFSCLASLVFLVLLEPYTHVQRRT